MRGTMMSNRAPDGWLRGRKLMWIPPEVLWLWYLPNNLDVHITCNDDDDDDDDEDCGENMVILIKAVIMMMMLLTTTTTTSSSSNTTNTTTINIMLMN